MVPVDAVAAAIPRRVDDTGVEVADAEGEFEVAFGAVVAAADFAAHDDAVCDSWDRAAVGLAGDWGGERQASMRGPLAQVVRARRVVRWCRLRHMVRRRGPSCG